MKVGSHASAVPFAQALRYHAGMAKREQTGVPPAMIRVRGARTHNLKNLDVELPRSRLTWVAGPSGSGKSSLIFDTLYAEARRRYLEGFSLHARRFLEQFERPDVEAVEALPPAIALRQQAGRSPSTATVLTATDIGHFLQMLFAHGGQYVDPETGAVIQSDSPESVAKLLDTLPAGHRLLIAFAPERDKEAAPGEETSDDGGQQIERLLAAGWARGIVAGQIVRLDRKQANVPAERFSHVIVDRLVTGKGAPERLSESLEAAFREGAGRCVLLVEGLEPAEATGWRPIGLNGEDWRERILHESLVDPTTDRELPDLTPALFNHRSPLGACPACHGRGEKTGTKAEKAGPCPACQGAGLNEFARMVRLDGRSFAAWEALDVVAMRERLSQWSHEHGNAAPGGDDASPREARTEVILPELMGRLETLEQLGLGYLTLDRRIETLSAGEARRVALAGVLRLALVNMLYVLDEPTAGLHPRDRRQVVQLLQQLRDGPNTVVVIDHDASFQDAADWVIEMGPAAGRDGGVIVSSGWISSGGGSGIRKNSDERSSTPKPLNSCESSYAATNSTDKPAVLEPEGETMILAHCRKRNLRDLRLAVPLGKLVVVAGVSGSGKSTLVADTLWPALRHKFDDGQEEKIATERPANAPDSAGVTISAADPLEEVVLVDQSAVSRSARSNVATYLKAFDAIRAAFAGTAEARRRNLTAGAFSFNSARGHRCPHCRGVGEVTVEMQFLPDFQVRCPECRGTRFRPELLEVKLHGRSIAEVLEMTVEEAFGYFRKEHGILRRLAPLKEVGLGYLPLGQPTSTFSGGELQRLRVASFLGPRSSRRTLFLFDEPTLGLNHSEIERLLECFRRLLSVGHSIVAIEHRLDFVRAADWVIELGPGGGPEGGELVAAGPPEHLAHMGTTATGRCLAGAR